MEGEIQYEYSSRTLEAEDFLSRKSERAAPAEASQQYPKREAPAGKGESQGPDRGRERGREKGPNDRPDPRGSLDRPNVFRSFGIPPRAATQMGIRKLLWIFWILSPQERRKDRRTTALRTESRPATHSSTIQVLHVRQRVKRTREKWFYFPFP